MTECPDQQVQNVQEAVKKQYGCEVPVKPHDALVIPMNEDVLLGVFLGLLIGLSIVLLNKPR